MIQVAKIINTHGLKGECKLYLTTDDTDHRFQKGRILYLDEKEPLTVDRFRMQKGLGYVYFKGIDTIEKAEELKGHAVFIPLEELPEPEENEYYYHELNACRVYDQNQEFLGTVVDILETGANIVLRVQHEDSAFLVPFVEAFIVDVDRENKKITINDMEGLR